MIFSTSKQLILASVILGNVAFVANGADLRGNNNSNAVENQQRELQSGFEIQQALQLDQMECRDDRDGSVVCQFRTIPPSGLTNVKKVYDCFYSTPFATNYCLSAEIQRESAMNVPSSAGGFGNEQQQQQQINAEVNQVVVTTNLQEDQAAQEAAAQQQQEAAAQLQALQQQQSLDLEREQEAETQAQAQQFLNQQQQQVENSSSSSATNSGTIQVNVVNSNKNCPPSKPSAGSTCTNFLNDSVSWMRCSYRDNNYIQNGAASPVESCDCNGDVSTNYVGVFVCRPARGGAFGTNSF